jgi:hypothetical protein
MRVERPQKREEREKKRLKLDEKESRRNGFTVRRIK